MYISIILSSIAIMLASLIGVVFVWKGFGQFLQKNKKYLTTFAIGVFGVVTYSLSKEAFHLTESVVLSASSIFGGVLLLYVATFFMPHHHHDTDDCCPEEHNPLNARRILLGDAIHNTGDGILLVSAFLIDTRIGIIAALGIFLHELVQEIAEFFILREAGYTTRKALMYNFLISGTILIGIIVGLFLSTVPIVNVAFIGLAAGGFLYILGADLLPHTVRAIKSTGSPGVHIVVGILGALTMLSVGLIAPHSHEHDESEMHMHSHEDGLEHDHDDDTTHITTEHVHEH
jgi:zinc transporter ZupT